MTVKEAATRLECSISMVYGLIGAGKLGCHRIGIGRGCIRISDQHIEDYRRASEVPAEGPRAPVRKMAFKHITLPK